MVVSTSARASGEHLLYPEDKMVYRQVLFAQLSDWGLELGVAVLRRAGQAGNLRPEPREPVRKAVPAMR